MRYLLIINYGYDMSTKVFDDEEDAFVAYHSEVESNKHFNDDKNNFEKVETLLVEVLRSDTYG